MLALLILCLAAGAASGCSLVGAEEDLPTPDSPPATERGGARNFDVERIAVGLNRPTFVGAAPGDSDALWVLEQPGRVVRLEGAERTVALDHTAIIGSS